MSAGKCKRGPEVLQCATSSSDDDSPRSADTSATTTTEPPSPALTTQHDYDVSSPGSSSTLSGGGGPSVVRLPGFTQHSQQTPRRPRVKKKKDDLNVASRETDVLCPHAAGQLASSRLTKHQLTPRTKPARGTLLQISMFLSCLIFINDCVYLHDILKISLTNAHRHTHRQADATEHIISSAGDIRLAAEKQCVVTSDY